MMTENNLERNLSDNSDIMLDINCDLAQSFGVYKNDLEFELLPYVTSVNVSCGLHSGDPMTIAGALKLAAENNLSVGAHVGYPDLQGFGYRDMNLSEEEIEALILYQIGAIQTMAKTYGVKVSHVRLHGALYQKALTDFPTMLAVVKSIKKADNWLVLLCAPCVNLEKACESENLKYAGEVFLDKKYTVAGLPNFEANDVVDIEYSKKQLESLLTNGSLINENGGITQLKVHSVHLNMKNNVSMELAELVKNKINAVPLAISILDDKSWM